MSKLVDRERLARLAAGLDARMKAAVKAEEERAVAREGELADAIANINNGENGILAQAKAHAEAKDAEMKAVLDAEDQRLDQAIKDEKDRAEGIESGLDERIAANEAFVAAQPAKDEAQDGRLTALEGKDTAHETRMQNIEDAAEALEGRVEVNEGKLEVIQGSGEGSIAKAQADAQAYTDQKIADLVDSAPEAMDTLNELAKAINDNKDVYDGYVEQHATAMANMKKELQDEIDADVKAEADRAVAKENELAQAIANEKDRAEGVEEDFEERIAANEAFVAAQPAKDQGQDDRIQALENKFAGDNSVDNKIKAVQDALDAHEAAANTKNGEQDNAIAAAQKAADDAQAAANKAQGEVDAVEVRMAAAEGEIDALQEFQAGHSHAKMESDIAANAAAIAKEITDRDAAIAKALEDYTTSDDMMAILGNVVATLNLSMENDKMILKLGGAEGIALSEVSLDMATEADIDAIINGLDAQ